MTQALAVYRPFCPVTPRPDVRRVTRPEPMTLADGSVWHRETVWTVYGSADVRPYAGPDADLPLPLSLRQGRWMPRDGFAPKTPAPAPRRANRFERTYGGHDSIHDYRVESLRNSALKRGAMTGADFLGDD